MYDPTVDVSAIERFKLAYLMHFFVQNKKRFKFAKIRLQDLYHRIICDKDATPICDIVARILRHLKNDPEINIARVDTALEAFLTSEKRANNYRTTIQRIRRGRSLAQLCPETRAKLLENLIECLYEDVPDFNFPTDFKKSSDCSGVEEESCDAMILKAGQDSKGASYYYMDDLRLYRERPQSSIISEWDVVVGPSKDQWNAFINSLSHQNEEGDLRHFLSESLFDVVVSSLQNDLLSGANQELDPANLRQREAADILEMKRKKAGSDVQQTPPPSLNSQKPLPCGMSTLTSTAVTSSSAVVSTASTPFPVKEELNTSQDMVKSEPTITNPGSVTEPGSAALSHMQGSHSAPGSNAAPPHLPQQHDSKSQVGGPHSLNSKPATPTTPSAPVMPGLSPMPSSVGGNHPVASPIPPSSAPPGIVGTPNPGTPGNAIPQATLAPRPDSVPQSNNNAAQSVPPASPSTMQQQPRSVEHSQSGGGSHSQMSEVPMYVQRGPEGFPENQQQFQQMSGHPQGGMQGPNMYPSGNYAPTQGHYASRFHQPPFPQQPVPQALVFTTEMLNEAAQMPNASLPQYHQFHPAVRQFLEDQQKAMESGSYWAGAPYHQNETLTEEQLQNRRAKIAKLERIQLTLNKRNQQISQGGSGQPGNLPPPGPLPPPPHPDSGGLPHPSTDPGIHYQFPSNDAKQEWQRLRLEFLKEKDQKNSEDMYRHHQQRPPMHPQQAPPVHDPYGYPQQGPRHYYHPHAMNAQGMHPGHRRPPMPHHMMMPGDPSAGPGVKRPYQSAMGNQGYPPGPMPPHVPYPGGSQPVMQRVNPPQPFDSITTSVPSAPSFPPNPPPNALPAPPVSSNGKASGGSTATTTTTTKSTTSKRRKPTKASQQKQLKLEEEAIKAEAVLASSDAVGTAPPSYLTGVEGQELMITRQYNTAYPEKNQVSGPHSSSGPPQANQNGAIKHSPGSNQSLPNASVNRPPSLPNTSGPPYAFPPQFSNHSAAPSGPGSQQQQPFPGSQPPYSLHNNPSSTFHHHSPYSQTHTSSSANTTPTNTQQTNTSKVPQNLTSASLASLARLSSQMPGPVGPFTTLQDQHPNPPSSSHPPSHHPPHPIGSSQQPQPPSIQVNNTFVNAQLNVQQMNYQHVNGPGVTSQMQIQQHVHAGHHTGGANQPPYPNSPAQQNPQSNPAQLQALQQQQAPSGAHPPFSGAPATSSSSSLYGNTNIQIQTKTPHTIQYMPAEPQPNPLGPGQAPNPPSTGNPTSQVSRGNPGPGVRPPPGGKGTDNFDANYGPMPSSPSGYCIPGGMDAMDPMMMQRKHNPMYGGPNYSHAMTSHGSMMDSSMQNFYPGGGPDTQPPPHPQQQQQPQQQMGYAPPPTNMMQMQMMSGGNSTAIQMQHMSQGPAHQHYNMPPSSGGGLDPKYPSSQQMDWEGNMVPYGVPSSSAEGYYQGQVPGSSQGRHPQMRPQQKPGYGPPHQGNQ